MNVGIHVICGLLGAIALTGGCCNHSSLVRASYSDEHIETKVRAELDGITSREERFHAVASMVDWSKISPRIGWGPYKVVRYHSGDVEEMAIPLIGTGYLGVCWASAEAVLSFDTTGEFIGVRREPLKMPSYPYKLYQSAPVEIADPWRWQSPQTAIRSEAAFFTEEAIATLAVDAEDSAASRIVELTSHGSWPVGLVQPRVRVAIEPPVDFRVVWESGPHRYEPEFVGSYLIQEEDFARRSGEHHLTPAPGLMFVPKDAVFYQCKLVLAPHDGVTVRFEMVESGEAS